MSFAKIVQSVESIGQETPEQMEIHESTNTAVDQTLDVIDATADMESKMHDIDQIDTGIDSAEVAVDRLADLQNTINEKMEHTGSLTEFEQRAADITHESIMASLGMPVVQLTNESIKYNQRASHLVATLEEKGQGLMKSIVESIKRALESVLVFIQDLLRNNYLLQRYWNKVESQVRAAKGKTPSQDTMAESARALTAGDYLSRDPAAVQFSINEMYATAMGLMKASDVGIDAINKLNFKFDELESRDLSFILDFSRHGIPGVKSGEAAKSDRAYGYLTGGRSVVRVEADLFGVSKAFDGFVKNGEVAVKIAVATPEQMQDIMGKAEAIMRAIKSFDSRRSYIKNALSRITQYLAQDVLFYPSMVSKGARDTRNNLNMIRGMRKVINDVIGRFPLESFKIAKAFIDYCKNSLKYYGSAQ